MLGSSACRSRPTTSRSMHTPLRSALLGRIELFRSSDACALDPRRLWNTTSTIAYINGARAQAQAMPRELRGAVGEGRTKPTMELLCRRREERRERVEAVLRRRASRWMGTQGARPQAPRDDVPPS